jgi:DNA repair exonuclease SbcCD ATPase subunit
MTSLPRIEVGLADLRSRYNQAAGQLDLLQKQKTEKTEQLASAKRDIALYQQVQALFAKASEFARQQLKLRIEETVTAALQAILATDSIEFQIDMRTLSGNPAADWAVVSRYGDLAAGNQVTISANPEDGRGGGVADIVSLALRLALLELARPKPEGPVLLDEPGKHVSREYLPNMAEFLKQYARKTGRQIIMITHAEPLADVADVSYRVSQKDGISEVTRL